jgi:hypothetical protein
MSSETPTLDRMSQDTLSIVAIDDEPKTFERIAAALPAGRSVGIQNYMRVEDLENSPPAAADIIIMDMFFGATCRVSDMFRMIDSRWPEAYVIVLSQFPPKYVGSRPVFRFFNKLDVVDSPGVLRDAVIAAVKMVPRLPLVSRERAIADLRTPPKGCHPSPILELRHRNIVYPLKTYTTWRFLNGKYSLDPLGDVLCGEGVDEHDARVNFIRRFHELFCHIQRTPAEWRTEAETVLWTRLSNVVAMDDYERSRTIVVAEEVGEILEIDPSGARIMRWHGGSHHDKTNMLNVEDLPQDMVGLGKNAWFSAVVEREFQSGELVKIFFGTSIAPPCLDPVARAEFWKNAAQGQEKG